MCAFWAIARSMTKPFTCWAITWPFAMLAIASFYAYSLSTKFYHQAMHASFPIGEQQRSKNIKPSYSISPLASLMGRVADHF